MNQNLLEGEGYVPARIYKHIKILLQIAGLNAIKDHVCSLLRRPQPLPWRGLAIGVLALLVFATSNTAVAQQTEVSGRVLSEKDQIPLESVTVTAKESGGRTLTDSNGAFRITVDKDDILIFTSVGYLSVEKAVHGRTVITTFLEPDESALDEVLVIGYGQTSRRLNTGNVAKLSAEDIQRQPVANPLLTMQGRLAGVAITTENGLPGGNVSVTIRGQGSIAAGNSPLYVIDGVPFLSDPLHRNSSTGANGAISPFGIIDPGSIASIEVLKDADATAIYGSRGSNGVMLITTNKGRGGDTRVNLNVSQGISQVSRITPYLNLGEYLDLRREAFANDGLEPTATNAPDLMVWDTTQATDWQQYMYGGNSNITAANLSLTGGSASTSFRFSGNFRRETTVFPSDDFNYLKGGGSLGVNHASKDGKLDFSLTASLAKDRNILPYNLSVNNVNLLPPNYPARLEDGTLNFSSFFNPMAALMQTATAEADNILTNAVMRYRPLPALSLSTSVGYRKYGLDQLSIRPAESMDPARNPEPLAYFSNSGNYSYIIEPRADYRLQTGLGPLTLMAGGTIQQNTNESTLMVGTGVNNPGLLGNLGAADAITSRSNTYTQYRYLSVFGRVNFNARDRYLINATFRRDGSSRFGPGRRYGNFGAIGVGWIFSEEAWLKDRTGFLSFGKLRASYGVTGNDQIADYQYLASYRSSGMYDGISTIIPARVANPDFGWETNRKLEAALELGFWQDRILLNAAFYRNRSGSQLVSYPLPAQSGFSGFQANLPALVENRGWELDMDAKLINGQALTWSMAVNLSIPRNTLLEFPNIEETTYANTYVVGEDLSVYQGYRFMGVDRETGIASFLDVNGDGRYSYADDRVVLGKTSPDYFGGVAQTLRFRGFTLHVLLEYVHKSSVGFKPNFGTSMYNSPEMLRGRWRSPGDNASLPRATTLASNVSALNLSSLYFVDGSYARLKNVSLSYTLPSGVGNDMGLHAAEVFMHGQNLWTFDGNRNYDPEVAGGTGFPPMRIITFGFNITL